MMWRMLFQCFDQMEAFFLSSHFINKIQPIPGALETLQKLKEDYDLHIVTSRQFAIEELTVKWVEQHFPGVFSKLHFGNHYSKEGKVRSKPEICREIGAVLLIDDSLQYAMDCYKADIPVLLFGEYAWNNAESACGAKFLTPSVRVEVFEPSVHSAASLRLSGSALYRARDWFDVPQAVRFLLGSRDVLSVAAVQMCSVSNKLTNLRTTERLVAQAVREHPELSMVCLPECCVFMGESSLQTVSAAELLDSSISFPAQRCVYPISLPSDSSCAERVADEASYDGFSSIHYAAGLCEVAHRHRVWLSVGGFPEKRADLVDAWTDASSASISNTHFLISPQGKIASPLYRKIHLFDAPLVGLQESKTTGECSNGSFTQSTPPRFCSLSVVILFAVPGNRLVSATVHGWNLGLTVCYDVRFPGLYRALRASHRILPDVRKDPVDDIVVSTLRAAESAEVQRGGAQVMLVPAAFTPRTGAPHWETLLRARAIETQSFVIAAAQAGQHNPKRASYGHSLIIDPWGTIGIWYMCLFCFQSVHPELTCVISYNVFSGALG